MVTTAIPSDHIETAGVDDLSGHGLIDAFDAVQTVSTTGSDCIDDLALSDQDAAGTLL